MKEACQPNLKIRRSRGIADQLIGH